MDGSKLPESGRVEVRPETKPTKSEEVQGLTEMMARYVDPYKAQPRFLQSKRRSTQLAKEAGIDSIPTYRNQRSTAFGD